MSAPRVVKDSDTGHEGHQCFVAMPITTPLSCRTSYRDDEDHFNHVLTHLFRPALAAAGMATLSPLSSGANLVHADIVDKIVKSDLVLCDMSGLNPNVFFEMGIRTALNRPMCFVVDDVTESLIPFDTGIVNYHVYQSHLTPWSLELEITALTAHIRASFGQSKDGNALWRHFGLRAQFGTEGALPSIDGGDKIEYLAMEVEALRRKFDGVLGGVAAAAHDTRKAVPLVSGDDLDDGQIAGALLAFDPSIASSENLNSVSKQLRDRLKRVRTRTEEVAIERLLTQIAVVLQSRAAAPR